MNKFFIYVMVCSGMYLSSVQAETSTLVFPDVMVNKRGTQVPVETVVKGRELYSVVIQCKKPATADAHIEVAKGFAVLEMIEEARLHFLRAQTLDFERYEEIEELLTALKVTRDSPDNLAWAKQTIARGKGWKALDNLKEKMENETDPEKRDRIQKSIDRAQKSLEHEVVRLYAALLSKGVKKTYTKYKDLEVMEGIAQTLVDTRENLEKEVAASAAKKLKIEEKEVISLWENRHVKSSIKTKYGIGTWLAEIISPRDVQRPSDTKKRGRGREKAAPDEEKEQKKRDKKVARVVKDIADAAEHLKIEGKSETITGLQAKRISQFKSLSSRRRFDIVKSLVAEEHFKVTELKSITCSECAGKGKSLTMRSKSKKGTTEKLCPNCLGLKQFRAVKYN